MRFRGRSLSAFDVCLSGALWPPVRRLLYVPSINLKLLFDRSDGSIAEGVIQKWRRQERCSNRHEYENCEDLLLNDAETESDLSGDHSDFASGNHSQPDTDLIGTR